MRLIITIVLSIVFSFSVLPAQEQGLIQVKSEVDTAVITIGDLITYSIIIDRAEQLRVERPGEGLNLGMFEIKSYNFHEPVKENGRIIERFDFTISVYDTGKFIIPPFPVAWFANDTTSKYNIITAPAINIYVKSVISGDEAKELKDVKPPVYIPFNWKFWLSMAGVIILLLVIAYLAYRLWKKRKEKGYMFIPPPPPVPAHERALADLEALFKSGLPDKKEYKIFFSKLSEIIRVYLEGRYYIKALEETSAEILRDVKEPLDDEALYLSLRELLSLSDLVKFAKYVPEEDEIDKVKQQAVAFVEQTKIVFEATEEEQDEASVNEEKLLAPAEDIKKEE